MVVIEVVSVMVGKVVGSMIVCCSKGMLVMAL